MRDLSIVRGHLPDFEADGFDSLLLNIHTSPTNTMFNRFDFQFSPTYLLFDADANEQFRTHNIEDILKLE